MGRLTPKDWENQSNEIWLKLGYIQMSDEPFRTFLSESLQKLAHYEDMEEQLMESAEIDIDSMVGEFMHYYNLQKENRLIELPCAVGDTVYRTILDEVYEYTVGSFLVDENGAWGMSLLFKQEEKNFAANMDCDNLGKTVFLTKEETEAKLKELEGDKE